jgi:uncharacterized protein (TIGR02145 family)
MKTLRYIFVTFIFLMSFFNLIAQSNLTIRGGGAVTVNGNTSINCVNPPAVPTEGVHGPSQTQITWNWNPVIGASGYKWSTINNYSTADDVGMSTTITETGLTCNTAYTTYVWAYNECGNSTAQNLTQTTAPCPLPCDLPFVDSRDGKTYNVVLIGTQCWMEQNLNIGTRISLPSDQTNNGIIEKYCYDDLESNCNVYGGLYQWNEAMQYSTTPGVQGICPSGWHLPTYSEWTILTDFLGGESVAGGKMKEAGLTHWFSPNYGATNSSGFTALPAGYRDMWGNFYSDLQVYVYFWTSTKIYGSIITRVCYNYTEDVFGIEGYNTDGFSVRCVRD